MMKPFCANPLSFVSQFSSTTLGATFIAALANRIDIQMENLVNPKIVWRRRRPNLCAKSFAARVVRVVLCVLRVYV